MRKRLLVMLGGFVFCSLLGNLPLCGQPDTRAKDQERMARFIFAGLKDNLDRLRRGVFYAQGRKVDDDPGLGRLEGEVELFSAFDYDQAKFRFDRLEPIRDATKRAQAQAKEGGPRWTVVQVGGKYARTPNHTVVRIHGDSAVVIHGPDEPALAQIMPLDVRTLGLVYFMDLVNGTSYEKAYDFLTKEQILDIAEEKPGLYRLTLSEPINKRCLVWFDASQGFAPIRLELHVDNPDRGPAASDLDNVSEGTWAQHNGVWVPRTFRIQGGYKPHRVMSYELAFNWESVNGPVEDKLFTVAGFDLPKRTVILDEQLGKPIVRGLVSGEPFPGRGLLEGHKVSLQRQWLLLALVATSAVVLALLLISRRRRLSTAREGDGRSPRAGEAN